MWTYNDELYHYGVLGMKWGKRKAAKDLKRRNKYLNNTRIMANNHMTAAKGYARSAARIKAMKDSDMVRMYDPEDIKKLGGAKKAKQAAIRESRQLEKKSISYAKSWMAANDAIMNAPVGSLKSNKDYRKLINKHLNID